MLRVDDFSALPGPRPTSFDHGAWHAGANRLFVAHTAVDTVEVINGHGRRHERALAAHREAERPAAGVTSVPRSLAASVSRLLTGALPSRTSFGRPLLLAAATKTDYILLLLGQFRAVKPLEERVP